MAAAICDPSGRPVAAIALALPMHRLTQQLTHELGGSNIRVNAIAPGPIDTDATRTIGVAPGSCGHANYSREQLTEIVLATPLDGCFTKPIASKECSIACGGA